MNLAKFQDSFSRVIQAQSTPTLDSIQAINGIEHDALMVRRVSLYRERVIEALATQLRMHYPTVHSIVGDDFMHPAALACLDQCPPTSADPLVFARTFPDFLSEYEPASAFPYLADVAMIDLGFLSAFHAADADSVSLNIFSQLQPEAIISRKVKLHPACYWFSSRYAIYDIWRLYNSKNPPATIDHRLAQHVAIVRTKLEVELHQIDGGLIKALDALDAGETLGAAFAQGSREDASFDQGAAIQFLVKNGLLIDVN